MKYALIRHNIEYSKSKEWFESQGVEYEVFDTYYLNYADDRLVKKAAFCNISRPEAEVYEATLQYHRFLPEYKPVHC